MAKRDSRSGGVRLVVLGEASGDAVGFGDLLDAGHPAPTVQVDPADRALLVEEEALGEPHALRADAGDGLDADPLPDREAVEALLPAVEHPWPEQVAHHVLLLSATAGALALAGARDLGTLAVALETASLPAD